MTTAAVAQAGDRPQRIRDVVREVGEVGAFAARALLELRGVLPYASEVMRGCAVLTLGTALLVGVIAAVAGAECTLFGYYAFRTIGAQSFTGAFSEFCGIRAISALFFGYIFAAKVGCGLVAEIGSMRIGEELDAYESVGIDPMRYVVGTRIAAIMLCLPFLAVIALAAVALGGYFVALVQLGEPSRAAFEAAYWGVQSPIENLFAIVKICAIGVAISLVATYYGYRARGGPVGVGAATARSMVVNLVLIHFIDAVGTSAFFGTPLVPFGG
jgi:phospholipid/cholesterol/gamma-HCH transport system permease protein